MHAHARHYARHQRFMGVNGHTGVKHEDNKLTRNRNKKTRVREREQHIACPRDRPWVCSTLTIGTDTDTPQPPLHKKSKKYPVQQSQLNLPTPKQHKCNIILSAHTQIHIILPTLHLATQTIHPCPTRHTCTPLLYTASTHNSNTSAPATCRNTWGRGGGVQCCPCCRCRSCRSRCPGSGAP